MCAIASQITSFTIVYSTVYSDADQRQHQSSASLPFVRGIHRGPVNSPHKWPVTRKMFPFDDVIMFTMEVITPPWWDLSYSLLVKGAPESHAYLITLVTGNTATSRRRLRTKHRDFLHLYWWLKFEGSCATKIISVAIYNGYENQKSFDMQMYTL